MFLALLDVEMRNLRSLIRNCEQTATTSRLRDRRIAAEARAHSHRRALKKLVELRRAYIQEARRSGVRTNSPGAITR